MYLWSQKTTTVGANSENKRLVDSIESTIVAETIAAMIKVRENKIHKVEKTLSDEDESADAEVLEIEAKDLAEGRETREAGKDMKIFIPAIDLEEDEEGKASTHRTGAKERLVAVKVPYGKEKIDRLAELAFGGYFWRRLAANREVLIEGASLEELMEDPDLVEFFKSDRDAVVGALKAEEDVAAIELNFKRMLLDLVGEMVHDLYLERYVIKLSA